MFGLSSNTSSANLSEEEKRRKLLAQMLKQAGPKAESMIDGADIGVKRLVPPPAVAPSGNNNPYAPNPTAAPPAPGNMMPAQQTLDTPEMQAPHADLPNQRAGNTGTGIPIPPTPPGPTGSRKAKMDAEAHDLEPAKREKGFWRRLGSGALKGVREWAEAGAPGGLGGLIGATATGGIASGISEKTHAEWGKQRKSNQLWQKYGKQMSVEDAEMKRQQEGMKTVEGGYKAQKAGIDAQQAAADPYIKAVTAKGYMTPDEVAHVQQTYGIDITDPNNGRFTSETRNGKTYIRRVNEAESIVDTSLPIEQGDQYYETGVPGTDKTVPAKPGQVLSTAVGVEQANVGRVERRETAEEKATQDAAEKAEKAQAAAAGAQATLDSLLRARTIAVENDESTESIDANIARARGALAEAQTAGKKRPPTEAEAREYLKGRGLSPTEIESIIKRKLKR